MNKKSRIYRYLLWSCLALILDNCIYYKTVPVPVNEIVLNEYLYRKKVWTIEGANHQTKRIDGVVIRKDSIFGQLTPLEPQDHPANKQVYNRIRGKRSKTYMHLYTNSAGFSDRVNIPLSDITEAKTHENAVGQTVAANVAIGVVAGAAAVGAIILILDAICNCPYVKVIGADTTQFQGSLFPGAISKSLERSDNLIMKGVPLTKNGQVNVHVSNELPEIEYLDQVELYEAINIQHSTLGVNALGHPISFNLKDNLLRAVTPYNRNITNEVQAYHGGFYDFKEQGNDYELNKVYLTFNKVQLQDHSMLIVKAKQSKWLEKVAEFFFQQLGTKFSAWVDRMDKVDPKKYLQNSMDRGISMNAYVKRNNEWEYLGSFENAGTLEYRNLALNLDLSNIKGETIEIKLESAHAFWDVDYVGVTDEWSEDINLTKLKTISAFNQDGLDILSKISTVDKIYVEQPKVGTFTDMLFEAPSNPASFLILRGSGYYHHKRNYTAKPNYAVLKELKKDKLSTHQLSRLLQEHVVAKLNTSHSN